MALLNHILGEDKPKEKGTSFSVVMVHYTKLIPSEMNNYSIEGIKELANMIQLSGGVKQNLLARKKTADEYELIAGHRRRLAVKYLVEELGEEQFSMMPVHVEKEDDTLSEINLILTNCAARERSDWEKMMEVERLTELIQAMQTGPEEARRRFKQTFGVEPGICGRELRKVVAVALGLSETKVANLNHINKNLSESLKERFKEGEIGVSVANEVAALSAKEQKELETKKEIRLADVKRKKAVSESDTGKQKPEEEKQIEGQTDVTDYPECLPEAEEEKVVSESDTEEQLLKKEKTVSESDTACPPEQHDCIRQTWGTSPEEQEAGKRECKKCWNTWKERQEHISEPEKSVSDSDTEDEEWFDKHLLEDMIAKAEEVVEHFKKEIVKPIAFKKALMQIQAYRLLMDEYVGDANE